MSYRDAWVWVTVLFFMAMPSHAVADVRIKEFYKMSPAIEQVRQICPWRSATTRGTIRLMKVEEKGAHRLYVQWLREGIAGTKEAALSTIAIAEINNNYYRFNLSEGRLMAGACSIETIMEDIIDERRFRLTLYLMGPGEYEIHTTRLLDGEIKLP
jgi:predicted lipoprotein